MSDFGSTKEPGVGSKTALKPHRLNGAVGADEAGDQFFISRLGRIFRFHSADVLTKEGVVEGVRGMASRTDEAVAVTW